MSGMRWWSEMHARAVGAIHPDCCGPEDGVWDPFRRYWVCDYHDGFNDAWNQCRETGGAP